MAIHLLRFLAAALMCLGATGCDDNRNPGSEPHNGRTPKPAASADAVELTLVTYNVANLGHGGDQTDNIVKFIQGSGANLVGLNELDSCNARHNIYQLKVLAEKLGGWSYHFGNAFDFAGGGYGNGALSDMPLLEATTVALPKGNGHEPRSIAVIETEDIVFGAVHLDFEPPEEAPYEQAKCINDWVSGRYAGYDKPVILCGDFNTEPGSSTQNEIERCWTRLSEPVLSWPTVTASMCLDYVFCYKGAVPAEAVETVRPAGIIDLDAASDHYPVRVKIRFEKNLSGNRPDRGVDKGTVKVGSVSLYGTAAGNAMSMKQAVDTDGHPAENVFEAYLPTQGGKLVVCDDIGTRWLLKDDGRIVPGEGFNILAAADCETIRLHIDFNELKWVAASIERVELTPIGSEAAPVAMLYEGAGKWRSRESFIPADGYSKYLFRVYSDRPESLYAWIRCADGTVGCVGEAGYSADAAFSAVPSLKNTRVSASINLLDRTQRLLKESE